MSYSASIRKLLQHLRYRRDMSVHIARPNSELGSLFDIKQVHSYARAFNNLHQLLGIRTVLSYDSFVQNLHELLGKRGNCNVFVLTLIFINVQFCGRGC